MYSCFIATFHSPLGFVWSPSKYFHWAELSPVTKMFSWRTYSLVVMSSSVSQSFTLNNYSDLLKEIPGYRDIMENNDSNLIRKKSVKELLEMTHSPHFSHYTSDFQQSLNDPNFEAFVDYSDYIDVFGRHNEDPYYEGVKVFQDVEHPSRDSGDSVEERLENMLGRDFFQEHRYILFIVFSLILVVLVLSCCVVCTRWIWQSLSSSNKTRSSSLINAPIYQPITIPIAYSQPPVMFNDLEASFPDESFLGNKKIYPGYL